MRSKVSNGTVCFLIKGKEVLLALIEYPSGERNWNGIGGVIENDENPVDAVIREFKEETFMNLDKESVRESRILHLPGLKLHVLTASAWSGEVKPKEPSLKELRWFSFDNIPYDKMLAGNKDWLPIVLREA